MKTIKCQKCHKEHSYETEICSSCKSYIVHNPWLLLIISPFILDILAIPALLLHLYDQEVFAVIGAFYLVMVFTKFSNPNITKIQGFFLRLYYLNVAVLHIFVGISNYIN